MKAACVMPRYRREAGNKTAPILQDPNSHTHRPVATSQTTNSVPYTEGCHSLTACEASPINTALKRWCAGGRDGGRGGADLHEEGLFQLQQAGAFGGCSLHHLHMAPHLLQLQPLRYQLLPHPLWLSLQSLAPSERGAPAGHNHTEKRKSVTLLVAVGAISNKYNSRKQPDSKEKVCNVGFCSRSFCDQKQLNVIPAKWRMITTRSAMAARCSSSGFAYKDAQGN